jgi:ribonuclease III
LVGRFIPILNIGRKKNSNFSTVVKSITGYKPKNIELYKLAFAHSSKALKGDFSVYNNQRLEFLGDAILGAIVAEYLFKKYPKKDEGFLTQVRSKLVNRSHLHQLAMRFGLDKILRANLSQKEKLASSACGDAFEALIGAMYLDLGFEKTKRFIVNKLLKYHVDLEEMVSADTDFKSKLQIYCQKNKLELKYDCEELTDAKGKKVFRVHVNLGNKCFEAFESFSKRVAEQKAAEIALMTMEHGEIHPT